jgi:hypothetical protein
VSAAGTAAYRGELHRRGLVLEWFTVAWNVIEGVVAMLPVILWQGWEALEEACEGTENVK